LKASAAREGRPIAVVDIGSNSVRLVAFERLSRAPAPIYNEKVLCGLGRGLGDTGRLHPAGAKLAMRTIKRFLALTQAMKAEVDVVATAAVRDAEDGASFVRQIERTCHVPVRVIAGEEEAHLSALGAISAIPEASGIVGDLGGGSLELIEVAKGGTGAHATLPFGPLRSVHRPRRDPELIRQVDQAVEALPWVRNLAGKTFYAVGGAWRSFARVHMSRTDYPLRVIHQYAMPRREAEDLAQLLSGLSESSLQKIRGVSRRRLETLPFASLILERILRLGQPSKVVFCAFGLREGLLFSRLTVKARKQDPLLAAAEDVGRQGARFEFFPDELSRWLRPIFPRTARDDQRLQRGAVLLADIGWRVHPDYRARTAFLRILHAPIVGVDHAERAFVALAVCARYRGEEDEVVSAMTRRLLPEERRSQAIQLGRTINLAFALSGGVPGLLRGVRLTRRDRHLTLHLPERHRELAGDLVLRRLKKLAESLDLKARVLVGRTPIRIEAA